MTRLETKVTTNADCSGFYFTDCTPLYNAVSSPYGYDLTGTVNFDPDDIDVDNIQLDVTLPNGTVVNLLIPSSAVDTSNIGTIGLLTYEVTATALGESSL